MYAHTHIYGSIKAFKIFAISNKRKNHQGSGRRLERVSSEDEGSGCGTDLKARANFLYLTSLLTKGPAGDSAEWRESGVRLTSQGEGSGC